MLASSSLERSGLWKAKEWIFFFPFILLQLILTSTVPVFGQKSDGSGNGSDALGVKTVVIDPGHGGKDPGAIGHSNIHEKDIVLDIALKLGERINDHFGDEVEVIYTRKEDKFVELHERGRIANENDADLFISLHANVVGNSNVNGCETFVLGLHRTQANLEVAKKENSAILMEDNHERHYGDFDPKDPDSYIALELMQSEYLEQSLHFASKAQNQFGENVGRTNRGVKQAGFLVLYRTTMPSVLTELGFISNPDEEEFLSSDSGKKEMASALFTAFRGYKKHIDQRDSFDRPQDSLMASSNGDGGKGSVEEKKPHGSPGQKGKENRNGSNGTTSDKKGIRFKVQIAASEQKRSTTPENFKGLSNVDAYISDDGVHKYTVGDTGSYKKAKELEKEVKDQGYPGAFIIAFKDGERIGTKKAVKLAKRSE